jgi:dinuclear metal center YbgI/SA1388 family protein
MIVKDVCQLLEELAPLAYAEDFDNVGLLVGDRQTEVSGILVTLDTLEAVVDEAIEKNCNLIVSFHPIIFGGLKQLTPTDYVTKTVIKAIKNDIAIYSMHTALDNVKDGVNSVIAQKLKLNDVQVLIPKTGLIKKLSTYIPKESVETVKTALYEAGAGTIGAYQNCSFSTEGQGEFTPLEGSNPTLGSHNQSEKVDEVHLQLVFTADKEASVIHALKESHPYETVAYDIVSLDNSHQEVGMGRIGTLEKPINEHKFLSKLKGKFGIEVIKHSAYTDKMISKVAVLGGSGAFAIEAAKRAGADAYVTADLKYHDFFKAEGSILLADIGHFESEQFTKNLLVEYLTKKIPNFAATLSETLTNPVKYY